MNNFFIVFGAKIQPDGTASATLKSRTKGAFEHAQKSQPAKFIVTGAAGKSGPAEADVMREILLQLGVQDDQIICERQGHDTLSSAIYCKKIIEECFDTVASVTVCSSPYHNPRCIWLLRILNIPAKWVTMPPDSAFLPFGKLLRFYLKEPVAIIWHSLILFYYLATNRVQRLKRHQQQ